MGATAHAKIEQDGSASSMTELAAFGKVIETGQRLVRGPTNALSAATGLQAQGQTGTGQGQQQSEPRRLENLPRKHDQHIKRPAAPNAQTSTPNNPGLSRDAPAADRLGAGADPLARRQPGHSTKVGQEVALQAPNRPTGVK